MEIRQLINFQLDKKWVFVTASKLIGMWIGVLAIDRYADQLSRILLHGATLREIQDGYSLAGLAWIGVLNFLIRMILAWLFFFHSEWFSGGLTIPESDPSESEQEAFLCSGATILGVHLMIWAFIMAVFYVCEKRDLPFNFCEAIPLVMRCVVGFALIAGTIGKRSRELLDIGLSLVGIYMIQSGIVGIVWNGLHAFQVLGDGGMVGICYEEVIPNVFALLVGLLLANRARRFKDSAVYNAGVALIGIWVLAGALYWIADMGAAEWGYVMFWYKVPPCIVQLVIGIVLSRRVMTLGKENPILIIGMFMIGIYWMFHDFPFLIKEASTFGLLDSGDMYFFMSHVFPLILSCLIGLFLVWQSSGRNGNVAMRNGIVLVGMFMLFHAIPKCVWMLCEFCVDGHWISFYIVTKVLPPLVGLAACVLMVIFPSRILDMLRWIRVNRAGMYV
ncbi:MAG: hypothetical protein V1809_02330 [Planctomycetota bacterium]